MSHGLSQMKIENLSIILAKDMKQIITYGCDAASLKEHFFLSDLYLTINVQCMLKIHLHADWTASNCGLHDIIRSYASSSQQNIGFKLSSDYRLRDT